MSGYAVVQSRALLALQAPAVTVEVHLANGLPSFTLVGLAETEVKEARERVRCAIQNSGLNFPNNKRITVNLAPADLPKDSGRFDLAIALGILAASGQIDGARLEGHVFAGELSLAGDLRAVRGALAMSLALRKLEHPAKLVLPMLSAQEAALAGRTQVYAAAHLTEVVAQFAVLPMDPENHAKPWQPVVAAAQQPQAIYPDMADVRGQALSKRALEVAAAGGHSVLMVGSPGAGKSMLAQRFAGLLPPMSHDDALSAAAMQGLSTHTSMGADASSVLARWGQRPTRTPHHTATAPALVGGGAPPRPGEISLAHHGVLFLDELPEFPRAALEALREPLETGRVSIARANQRTEFPAQFQLIAAMNPCGGVALLRYDFSLIPSIKLTRVKQLRSPPKTLPELLAHARRTRNLLQKDAAAQVGVCMETWLHWENAQTNLFPCAASARLVEFLGFNPMPMTTFPERLYALRFTKGWNQNESAAQAGVNPATWSNWEKGIPIKFKKHQKLMDAFFHRHESSAKPSV